MSPTQIIWCGVAVLGLIAAWAVLELRAKNRILRIIVGAGMTVAASVWLSVFSRSLGDFYDGMREYRLIQTLLHELPKKSSEIYKWSSDYDHYVDSASHQARIQQLERIVGERQ